MDIIAVSELEKYAESIMSTPRAISNVLVDMSSNYEIPILSGIHNVVIQPV